MPQLIAIAVAGAGLYAGLCWLQRKMSEQAEAMARTEQEQAKAKDHLKEMDKLEWDAETATYRPAGRQTGA